jgi:hypothetical protein
MRTAASGEEGRVNDDLKQRQGATKRYHRVVYTQRRRHCQRIQPEKTASFFDFCMKNRYSARAAKCAC